MMIFSEILCLPKTEAIIAVSMNTFLEQIWEFSFSFTITAIMQQTGTFQWIENTYCLSKGPSLLLNWDTWEQALTFLLNFEP